MQLRFITRGQIDEIVDSSGIDADRVRTAYCGRGMYGATCLAVVGADDFAHFLMAAPEVLERPASPDTEAPFGVRRALAAFRTDAMGRDEAVYYWPHLPVSE